MTDGGPGARTEILERLRCALAKPAPIFRSDGDGQIGSPSPVTHAEGDQHELALMFGRKLEAISGSCELVGRAEDVALSIVRKVRDWLPSEATEPGDATDGQAASALLSWAPELLPVAGLDRRLEAHGLQLIVPADLHDMDQRRQASDAAVGLTGVEAAFAGTGSIAVVSGPGKSRAASLLPLHHIALIPMRRVYPTVEAWLADLRANGRSDALLRDSAQVVFITGPSKSADIELNLTLGVHGPRVVHAIVFDDTSQHTDANRNSTQAHP